MYPGLRGSHVPFLNQPALEVAALLSSWATWHCYSFSWFASPAWAQTFCALQANRLQDPNSVHNSMVLLLSGRASAEFCGSSWRSQFQFPVNSWFLSDYCGWVNLFSLCCWWCWHCCLIGCWQRFALSFCSALVLAMPLLHRGIHYRYYLLSPNGQNRYLNVSVLSPFS